MMSAQVANQAPGDLSGVERLDLSVASPLATAHVSLSNYSAAAFKPATDSDSAPGWSISAGGFIRFKVVLPDQQATQQGVVFILESDASAENQSIAPISISVNQNPPWVMSSGSTTPAAGGIYAYSWYLPPELVQVGDNFVSVNLASTATTAVLITSVSLMGFGLQMQQQSNWCWAAVATSAVLFFSNGAPLTQCSLASTITQNPPGFCCTNGDSPQCDQFSYLSQVLSSIGLLDTFAQATLPVQSIRAQIDKGVPVAARIGWDGGGGHFVIVTGVGADDPRGDDFTLVEIEDPSQSYYGSHFVPYATLVKGYRGSGSWTHYYLLKSGGRS